MKYVAASFFVLFSTQALACPDFRGKWESSGSLSAAFNDNHAVIEDRTREFRSQIIGKSTVTYTQKRVTMEMDNIEFVSINGVVFPWDSSPMTGPYEVLGCTDNVVVIRINYNDVVLINTLNFEDENTYWVYEGTPGGTGNQHTREYFVRATSK